MAILTCENNSPSFKIGKLEDYVNYYRSQLSQQIVFVLNEGDTEQVVDEVVVNSSSSKDYKWDIIWRNVIGHIVVHVLGFYGLFLLSSAKLSTIFFMFVCIVLAQIGWQVGGHRLWSHRSFKANLGVRWFLSICHVMAFQKDAFEWARDHRVHHKYAETDADPHNSARGFFFAHVGWSMLKKLPEVCEKGKTLDLKDLYDDPVVMFQHRHYLLMSVLFHVLLPTFIPVYLWDERKWVALVLCVMTRHVYTLNIAFLINSWGHSWGNRPYDIQISPAECIQIRHFMAGEGFHNYHHTFPWDYSASEHGPLLVFNPATAVIDFFHYLGWAWDLKKVKSEIVENRKNKTGNPKLSYNTGRGVFEWASGLATLFGPFLLVRYVFIYLGY